MFINVNWRPSIDPQCDEIIFRRVICCTRFLFKGFNILVIMNVPGPLITDGWNSNEMLIFQKDIRKDDLGIGILKVMRISLPNSNYIDFRS